MKLRFRDGERELPDYIGELLAGIDVRRMTYDEALAAGNRKQLSDRLNAEQQRVVQEHLASLRRMGQ